LTIPDGISDTAIGYARWSFDELLTHLR